ncbi:MAG TPA: cation transporter [Pirellulales bacterium]|jgi:divalent metal cation (Fe/Co/Zn/Cd) transporter|nr:cation transporter [Pirellulales bacterium]
MSQTALMPELDHEAIVRRGRRLAYWTLFFTAIEAGLALFAGERAASTALIGFGVDSLVEVFSAGVVLWRLQVGERGARRERMALRLIGASLLLLALYVAIQAAWRLLAGQRAEASYLGLGTAVGSLVVMQWLARSKRRVAAELESGAVHADSLQSEICSYLAAILLAGLALNALFGWWWADPAAALIMVPLIAREGFDAWRGQTCACSHVPHTQ